MAALSEDDLEKVSKYIFDCGYGIHIEKPKKFIECLLKLV